MIGTMKTRTGRHAHAVRTYIPAAYSIRQAARILSVDRSILAKRIADGDLPASQPTLLERRPRRKSFRISLATLQAELRLPMDLVERRIREVLSIPARKER